LISSFQEAPQFLGKLKSRISSVTSAALKPGSKQKNRHKKSVDLLVFIYIIFLTISTEVRDAGSTLRGRGLKQFKAEVRTW
jgi:hypothetical protein